MITKQWKNPLVSVVVPIYNVAQYLEQCLQSLRDQTLHRMEFILVNDGSTDASLAIMKRFAAKDKRFVIINKKNTGYGHSMNVGFDKARGEYIGIVESDDYADADMFKTLYKAAAEHRADFVKSNYFFYYSKGVERNELFEHFRPEECGKVIEMPRLYDNGSLFRRKNSIWAAIYRTRFVRWNGIRFLETPGASFQDTAFSFKVISQARRSYFLYDAFLHYRQDNENSSVNNPGKVYCVCDEWREINLFLTKNPSINKQIEKTKNVEMYRNFLWNYERIAIQFQYPFLQYIQSWFIDIIGKKEVDERLFNWWEWRDLNRIAKDPLEYHTWRIVERYEQAEQQNKPIVYQPAVTPFISARKIKKLQQETTPFISIIIPVYNVEKYVRSCLESVVNQGFSEIEIICVNDGSTDHSLSILEEYGQRDTRIRIINKKNGGLSSARNAGMRAACGDYLMFLDSDDYIEVNNHHQRWWLEC